MSNTNFEMTGILLGQEVRNRKNTQERITIIQQTMALNSLYGHLPDASTVFSPACCLSGKWKKQYQEGSLTAVAAGEEVVPASELAAALKQVREL